MPKQITNEALHLFIEVESRACYALGVYQPDKTVANGPWNHCRPGTMDRAGDESYSEGGGSS